MQSTASLPGGGGGGGTPALRISRKKGSFLRPPHVRDFVKEGYFFVPRYEIRRVTPEVSGLPSLLPPLAAAKHAEDYKILS